MDLGSKVMSLLFNTLSRFVIDFLPRSKCLFTSWLQSLSAVILEPKKIISATLSNFSPSFSHEVIGLVAMIFIFWILSFKPALSLSFTFIKRLFSSSSLSAIKMASYAYLRLLIFFHLDSSLWVICIGISHDVKIVKMKLLVIQLCPTLCDSIDCSPSGSFVHGILQARIMEWIAIPFSRGSSQSGDQVHVSCIEADFYHLSHQGSKSTTRKKLQWSERTALKHVYYHMWNRLPVQVRCMRQGARGWCTGMTQRDGMGREVGGGFRMGNTCKPITDSCQSMAKPTTIL